MKNQFIAIVASSSGGHIIPALTYAKDLSANNTKLLFFTTEKELDARISAEFEVDEKIILPPFALSSRMIDLALVLPYFLYAYARSMRVLSKRSIKRVITTGGITALPVCLAAWSLRIPIELFELNAVPGKAIRFLAPFATQISVCFDEAKHHLSNHKTTYVPYPVRYGEHHRKDRDTTRQRLAIPPEHKILLVLGGSQGSQSINALVKDLILHSPEVKNRFYIIHQAGAHDYESLRSFYQKHKVAGHVFGFEYDLSPYYSIADRVIGRGGAGTLWELIFFKKKSIIIPLEKVADNHQYANARACEQSHPQLIKVVREVDGSLGNVRNQLLEGLVSELIESL